MPASVYEFGTVKLPPRPASLFLETSFVRWARAGSAPGCPDPRCKASYQFLARLSARSDLDVWTTPMVFEEALFSLLNDLMRRAATKAGVKWEGWGKFKKTNPKEFEAVLKTDGRQSAKDLHDLLDDHGVVLRFPRHPQRRSKELGRGLVVYARWLLSKYLLEPADAFHVGCARLGQATAIVTNDKGFQAVDGLRVLAHKRV